MPRMPLRRTLLALGTAGLLLAVGAPARAAGDSPGSSAAKSRAGAASAKVEVLLDGYGRAGVAEAAAVRELAGAIQAQDAAQVTTVAEAAQLRAARGLQAKRIRAIYAGGGPAGLFVSVLGSTSPDDLIWRLDTADRIAAAVLADGRSGVQRRQAADTLARHQAQEMAWATARRASALDKLQKRTDQAAAALAGARQTLRALDQQARQEAAAARAARAIAAAQAAAAAARTSAAATVTATAIPAEYEAAYRSAARTCPGMDWTLLAGVGQIESGHGRNNGPSSAGAIGPMQFMPRTFTTYAVDGDGDGSTSAWDPQDAIFTAARYLCVSGARGGSTDGVHKALLAYNHAEWYVDLVLAAQAAISATLP